MKSTIAIGDDMHVLQLRKWTFTSQAMQNNANVYLAATRTQTYSLYDNAILLC